LVHGSREDTEALREDVATMLAPLGLRLSPAKTQVVHMSDGFDFLGSVRVNVFEAGSLGIL
jgi:RNA-directed DNA polymerase